MIDDIRAFLAAGPQRRAALEGALDRGINYVLGPTGIPERLATISDVFNPVRGMEQAGSAAQTMMDPSLSLYDRIGGAGRMATEIAGVAAPAGAIRYAGKSADDAARALMEAYLGASATPGAVAANDFVMDEAGAIRAWHGSPHDFDKFSMDKIGTGEGAQAYGHGLYFAESEDVARNYRSALAPGMGDGNLRAAGVSDGDLRAMRQFTQSAVDPDTAMRDWLHWIGKKETPELRSAFMRDWSGRNDGRLYEVNIDANPEDFLDWDKPLSEQPPRVQSWARQRYLDFFGREPGDDVDGDMLWKLANPQNDLDGRDWLDVGPAADASNRLREAGIPGIRYLDQGSRAAGDGSRNYVVFDDNLISIIKKYGIAGAAGLLGMSVQDLQAQADRQMQTSAGPIPRAN